MSDVERSRKVFPAGDSEVIISWRDTQPPTNYRVGQIAAKSYAVSDRLGSRTLAEILTDNINEVGAEGIHFSQDFAALGNCILDEFASPTTGTRAVGGGGWGETATVENTDGLDPAVFHRAVLETAKVHAEAYQVRPSAES